MSHTHPIRIYYEDTDAGGIVYHASFIRFGERGRTEFLRHIGYNNSDLTRELGTVFVVRHIEIDYLKPAYLDDLIDLTTSIKDMRNSSFVMQQTFYKQEEIICDLKVTLVCVKTDGIKPVRLPDNIRTSFERHLNP